MPDGSTLRGTRLLGRLLPRELRQLMFEPYCCELWRARIAAGNSFRSRARFWLHMTGGFGLAMAYGAPQYLRGPDRATRVFGVPVVFLVLALLGLVVSLRECAFLGLALALTG